ncbi:MAG: glutamate--cysteine ligase [Alphaproteobacteria bacterium]|nr:glutamate--cysteine ligase [Alphaproteobacteria bacterium]
MAGTPSARGTPIDNPRALVDWFAAGCKPRSAWKLGTEHEKFVFRRQDLGPVPYDDPTGGPSIQAVLAGLTQFGWQPVQEAGRTIALVRGQEAISLEPAGQLELSGAAVDSLHETYAELVNHLTETRAVTDAMGAGMLLAGHAPHWQRAEVPWMPKGRYAIMKRYMPTRGTLGLDMMTRTCTVQVNLDYGSEADMVAKMRVAMALQPIASALFANSPFAEGRPNGFKSWRSAIWLDTDPDRSGLLPFVFEDGFGFERYAEYMLDVPMYFVWRDGYIDAAGQSFRDFLDGRLPALPGERATIGDFVDHVSTAFPDVRLKRYLEMRGADAGPPRLLTALPALWVGLLYDEVMLEAASDLVADWSMEEHVALRRDVPRLALAAPFRQGSVRDVALEVLTIAREGLRRRAIVGPGGEDEAKYLDPLFTIAASGRTVADDLLADFHDLWGGDIGEYFRRQAL